LLALLEGVGVHRCAELAALDPEAVEVRFGAAGVRLWRLARADDLHRLFPPIPLERPHASLDFIDYLVTDPERLVFTINALLESVTGTLRARGAHARRLLLTFSLASGGVWRRSLRPARPTASRDLWLRQVRGVLERVALPDAVAGVALEVEATEPAAVRQGDLFDRGFATAGAVEAALARLLERQAGLLVQPRSNAHPLPERRVAWGAVDPFQYAGTAAPAVGTVVPGAGAPAAGPELSLYLLPEPLPITVECGNVTDHGAPLRYRDRAGWSRVVTAAGPDRISGGQWAEAYAREYFRCVTEEGALVLLFRDARRGAWFLHGWWG
jgi:protein ImuB